MVPQSNPLFDLKEKVAIITGGSGVLGYAIAQYLLKSGAKIALLARNQKKLNEAVAGLTAISSNVIGMPVDVNHKASLEEAAQKIMSKWSSIDLLINAAGGNTTGAVVQPNQNLFDLSLEDFNEVVQLNLQGTVLPCLVFGKHMGQIQKGSIINFSSMAVSRAITRVAGYSASKAGMENFTRWFAVEMAMRYGEQIRVNAICPGFFLGHQNRSLLLNEDGSPTSRGLKILNHTPMGRFGKAEEINGAIHFLASEASSFITGSVIYIDGGFSAYSGV
jgi:NAD(P)-dependent dehydrogenase (short-subunit alcohol dehydrogenase family)